MALSKQRRMFRPAVVDRYLLKEISLTLLAVVAVLLLISLSNRGLRYLAEAAAGVLPAEVVFTLLTLKSIKLFTLLLPLAFYLAVLLVLGRMYRDSEMTALAACGIGNGRLLRPVAAVAALFALLLGYLSFTLVPWAQQRAAAIEKEAEQAADITGIAAGRFKESRRGDRVLFVEELSADKREMRNIFVQMSRKGGRFAIQSSDTAHLGGDPASGDRSLVMEQGTLYEGRPGDGDWRVVRFASHAVRIKESEDAPDYRPYDLRSTAELWGAPERQAAGELHWRLAAPLSALLFALISVPLARIRPRQGRYGKLFTALLVYVFYYNALGIGRNLLERDVLPAAVGLWWVHLLVLLLAAGLWLREAGGWRGLREALR